VATSMHPGMSLRDRLKLYFIVNMVPQFSLLNTIQESISSKN
jgi:hypothetical protein